MLLSKLGVLISVYRPQCIKFSSLKKFTNANENQTSFIFRTFCSKSSHIVQMRGLEYDTKESDIIDFFKPLGIMPKAVHLKFDGSGRVTGVSEVEFSTHAEAVVAMRKKNAFMGNRFIRLTLNSSDVDEFEPKKKASVKEFVKEFTKKSNIVELNISKNIVGPVYHSVHVVKMTNVPKRMTDQAIYEFFRPVGAIPISTKPIYNRSGIRTGEFEVQFLTKDDAIRAMAKNNAYLGKKFVELSLVKQR